MRSCNATDVNTAVIAAHDAFKSWSQLSGMQRGKLLTKAAQILRVSLLLFCIYKGRSKSLQTDTGMAPNYIEDLCLPVSCVSTRAALRSAARGDLIVLRTRLRLGNRPFSVAGPAAWNSLPSDIRTASTLSAFKNRLKTHLFLQSYYVSSQST